MLELPMVDKGHRQLIVCNPLNTGAKDILNNPFKLF
jgi:hypothetical protein